MRYSPGGTTTVPPPAADTRSMHFWIAGVESVRPVGSAPASVTTARAASAGNGNVAIATIAQTARKVLADSRRT